MWLWGDLFKLYYYATNDGPLELVLCSMFQSSIDVAILAQFTYYGAVQPLVETNEKKVSLKSDTEIEIQTTDLEDSVNISEINELQTHQW